MIQRTALPFLLAAMLLAQRPYSTWTDYGGEGGLQYSSLRQINKSNVARLELAWSYLAPGPGGRFGFNPLIVDGVMYVVGKDSAIVALDGATGKQLWSRQVEGQPTNRGFNFWSSKDGKDQRLIFAADSYLQQINIKTGQLINTFGNDGRVNLREGLGRDPKTVGSVQSGSPGRVWENLIILGSAPGEAYDSPPGDIRAYDVITGKHVWTFHTVPRPGEFGYDTWPPDAWKYAGGVNTWGEFTVDEKRGIGYFPLGSPTFDLYGGDRIGANLFGNSIVALDLRTGKRLWHFQTVHHDLWDYDLTTGPKLLTVRHNGRMVDIVAQGTKFGLLYVFNRVTGEPLWPIEERPVPKSDVPGEQSWPTQPFPTRPEPYSRLKFGVEDINPYLDDEEKARIKEIVRNARNEGIFTPPSDKRQAIAIPGELGGTNWGGTAADPTNGMLYVRAADQPAIHILTEVKPGTRTFRGGTPEQRGGFVYAQTCIQCHGPERANIAYPKTLTEAQFRSVVRSGQGQMPAFDPQSLPDENLDGLVAYFKNPAAGVIPDGDEPPGPAPGQKRYTGRLGAMFFARNGLSAIGPPWGQIVAYDLNEGTIKWRAPLGTVPALEEKGIKGTGNNFRVHASGPVVTAGGLIFIGNWADLGVRAYDKDNGKLLWERFLPARPQGIAATYEVRGRQYVVWCAVERGGTVPPGSIAARPIQPGKQGYYVFALPRKTGSGREL
jgi:quinoprotein glucose dehydrogenase